MKYIYIFTIIFVITLNGCAKVRESAGVTRKNLDEFKVIENPPLVIPPDFNLIPPNQLGEKNIDDIEKDLAKEILFGLETNDQNNEINNSTMSEILLGVKSSDNSSTIRDEIDREFANEKKIKGVFDLDWEDEIEVLDAVKESERIRNNNFNTESKIDKKIPVKTQIIKKKKNKRFFFF